MTKILFKFYDKISKSYQPTPSIVIKKNFNTSVCLVLRKKVIDILVNLIWSELIYTWLSEVHSK